MNLREIIKKEFGAELPIRGGMGTTLEDAIIIEYDMFSDYVGLEYAVLKYLYSLRGIKYSVIQQQLQFINERRFDVITVETQNLIDGKITTGTETCYFDITDCFGKNW